MGRGIARTIKSVMTSEMPKPRLRALVLMQRFSVVEMLLHQYLICAPHWNAVAKKKERDHRVINVHMAKEYWLKRQPTKIRR